MLNIEIEPSQTTPYVSLDMEKKKLEIKGKSSPERAIDFYYNIIDQLNQLDKKQLDQLEAHFMLEYFNTSSSKCLFDLFRSLKKLSTDGIEISYHWHFEEDDEDMMETGEDYAELLDLDIHLISEREENFA
jgi:hypothetical protein